MRSSAEIRTGRWVNENEQPLCTIIIPTYNGAKYIGEILEAISQQKTNFDFEVLVIDSGSEDMTLEVINKFERVRLHQIPNEEFGHGKTRNLGAQIARGEYLVYLSHDAIPANEHWLEAMVTPLSPEGIGAAGVLGKQVARPGCFPMLKYEIKHVFAGFGPDYGLTLFQYDSALHSEKEMNLMSFYSDVNSAVRRDFLLKVIPYQDLPYSEDMAFGLDIIKAGYIKVYSPAGLVIHSNDLTLAEYKLRLFDEILGMRRIGEGIPKLTWWRQFAYPIYGSFIDSLRILNDKSYPPLEKLKWLAVNPLFHFSKWRAFYIASNLDLNDTDTIKKYSLEQSRK